MAPTYVPNDSLEQVCLLAGALAETGIYGIYVSLFIMNFVYMRSRREVRNDTRLISKPFFWALIVMFMLATLHEFLTIFRVIRAYAGLGADGTPLNYTRQIKRWDNTIYTVLLGVMITFGDVLVIYRCYIVWNYKLGVVALPLLLLVGNIGLILTLDVRLATPFMSFDKLSILVNISYPVNLAQNVLTTGLITWKILRQHQSSTSTGLASTDRISLITVTRIIVESALIYTLELVFLIFFYFANSPLHSIFLAALVPSIGIVFALIALRVRIARDRSVTSGSNSSFVIRPAWPTQDDEEIDNYRLPARQSGVFSVVSRNDFAVQILGPRKSVNITTSPLHESQEGEGSLTNKPVSMSI